MKYIFIALTAVIGLASCGSKKEEKVITYQSKIPTEQKLIEFINGNQNWDDSTFTETVTDSFKVATVTWSKGEKFLHDLKFTCTDLRDTTMGPMTFKLATFDLKKADKLDSGSVYNQMKLRINALFQDASKAQGLAVGKDYFVEAAPYKQVKRETIGYDNTTKPATYNLGTHLDQVYSVTPVE